MPELSGRELDALVAEKVMGYAVYPVPEIHEWRMDGPTINDRLLMVPEYSSSGDGMLAVIEAMREKGFMVQIEAPSGPVSARAIFMPIEGDEGGDELDGATLSIAVSLAALKAVGVEVPS